MHGHLWTILPYLRDRLAPPPAGNGEAWQTSLDDPRFGTVRLTGVLDPDPHSTTLVLIVHGLGGSADSNYCLRAARVASLAGCTSLRLSLRGADRSGDDFYHAGLTDDLSAALASPALARYERIYLLGVSMGGHVCLRYAARPDDPRVRAVAAICAVLDLAATAAVLDSRAAWPYRFNVLGGLKEIYGAAARRGKPVPTPWDEVRRIRTFREWDTRTVAPRHGFADADDYYAQVSAGPRLAELRMPALYLGVTGDPMVTVATVQPWLVAAPSTLDVRWLRRGGHVSFPRRSRVYSQAISWLLRR